MGQQFYYLSGGEEVGPLSAADLKATAASGRLKPSGKIRKDGSDNWTPASQVKGLFADAGDRVAQAARSVPGDPGHAGEANRDAHEHIGQAAGHVEMSAKTVSKVAKATGKVADAVSDVADSGDKISKAVTAVAGLSAGGSTLLGGVGDFLRPLGPINLVVFGVATVSAVVFFVTAKRRGAKVKLKVNVGTVASLCVALVFGLWTGLARIFHAYKARMYCAVAELVGVSKVTPIFLLPGGSHRYDRA